MNSPPFGNLSWTMIGARTSLANPDPETSNTSSKARIRMNHRLVVVSLSRRFVIVKKYERRDLGTIVGLTAAKQGYSLKNAEPLGSVVSLVRPFSSILVCRYRAGAGLRQNTILSGFSFSSLTSLVIIFYHV